MKINHSNLLKTTQRLTFRKVLIVSSAILFIATVAMVAIQTHYPEKVMAAGCDAEYSLDWADSSTWNVTCGTVNASNWSVKGNMCIYTSPSVYASGNPGDPDKEVTIAVRVNQSGNLDGNDTAWVYMKTDGILRRTFVVKGDSVSKVFSVTQTVPIKADGYFNVEIKLKNDKSNELWQIKNGDVTACIRTLNPLPINLSDFNAKSDIIGNSIIEWSTMSETNNAYFAVERSSDGYVFDQIHKTPGAGNSNSLKRYSYTDKTPFSNINYYRLRQVDYDGQSTLSKTVKVYITKKGKTKSEITVYPNPTSGKVNIAFHSERSEPVTVIISTQTGKVIFSNLHNAKEGDNSIQHQLPSNIKPGSYNLRVVSQNEIIGSEVIIIK